MAAEVACSITDDCRMRFRGTRACFHLLPFCLYEPRDIRYRRFQHTMFCLKKTMCRIFCDQNFTESATHSLIDFTGALLSRCDVLTALCRNSPAAKLLDEDS